MDKQISSMLKVTLFLDLIIGAIAGVILKTLGESYIVFVLLGIGVGYLNFGMSSIIGHFTFSKLTGVYILLFVLSYFFRIFLTALIGYIIFTHNKYGALTFMLSYTLHFISIVIYSLLIRNNEN